ncbi:tail protein X [Aliarcobacter cryaerophilus]|uniref:tail protein X n=1 Tax=Aliarcobacter cryaerophilus TaxID=28198 RepID=UPI0021B568E8|nr:tail protein X [Aliarcobacter cryaerophilus]MCT7405604.1 tail protein X [Aliarcobacter cryaerophilus]MCT7503453.1 tail protein X [Aliarcobacter cryaerophilus]
MFKYTVTQNTTLDKVIYQFYKNLDDFKVILEANPNLKNKVVLEVGDVVNLPILEKKQEVKVKRLWD